MGFFNNNENPNVKTTEAIDGELTPENAKLVNDNDDDGLKELEALIKKLPSQEEIDKEQKDNEERAAKIKAALDAMPKAEKPEENNTNWITNEIKSIVDDIDANSTGVMDKLSTIKDLINQTKNIDTGPSVLAKAKIGLLVEALKKSAVSSLDEKLNEIKAIPGVDVEKKGPGSGIHLELQSVMAGKLIDDIEQMKNEIEKM